MYGSIFFDVGRENFTPLEGLAPYHFRPLRCDLTVGDGRVIRSNKVCFGTSCKSVESETQQYRLPKFNQVFDAKCAGPLR
jgi:hypothetical protein